MFFIAVAVAHETSGGGWILMRFLVEQLGCGMLIGLVIGLAGGWLLGLSRRKSWMAGSFLRLGVAALPLSCVLASEVTSASMFIAAFVAGLATNVGYREVGKHSVEFAEGSGQLFDLFVFFLFGLFIPRFWGQFTVAMLAYGVLSLTLIRMLPVAIALKGSRVNWPTILFMGWFGPRGLASIVLALVYLEGDAQLAGEATIKLTVMVTVPAQHLRSRVDRASCDQPVREDRCVTGQRSAGAQRGRHRRAGRRRSLMHTTWLPH
jgi:sodium/hydrogen antiporter